MKSAFARILLVFAAFGCSPEELPAHASAAIPASPTAPEVDLAPKTDAESVPGYAAFAAAWKGGGPATPISVVGQAAVDPDDPMAAGKRTFVTLCASCHQVTALGIPGAFPPLSKSDFLMADKTRSIGIVLHGLHGPVVVNGTTFTNVMPPQAQLSDRDISNVLTFVRNHFGNSGEPVSVEEVAAIRAQAPTPVPAPVTP